MDRCDRPACELRLYVDRDGCLRVGLTDQDGRRHEAVRLSLEGEKELLVVLYGLGSAGRELADRFWAATRPVDRTVRESFVWLEYERRKLEIASAARGTEEYERRIAALAKELGL